MPVNISEHFKKEFWKRRIIGDKDPPMPTFAENYAYPDNETRPFRYLTQEDFMREIEPSAHDINSRYQSTRSIKELHNIIGPDGKPMLDAKGNPVKEWVIVGFDELETTRVGFQRRFALTKAAHFAGAGWGIYNEQKSSSDKEAHRRFDNLNSWRDTIGSDMMLMEVALSCFQTGDAGVYSYATDTGDIEYKVYSFLEGYEIFPDIDENRQDVYYVRYSLKGKPAVDVFGPGYIQTWVKADLDEKTAPDTPKWLSKVRNWFDRKGRYETSEDGWKCVVDKQGQIGKLNQFTYFRIPDIPSGVVQDDISGLERTLSFVGEGVKNTTFDTLFIKATKIKNLPATGSHGSVIGVDGDVESLKAADAKRLPPSDVSNVATIDIKEKKESILHSSLSVIVDPDILRSGADSTSAMRLCFNDEEKWCRTMQPKFFKPLRHFVDALKHLVAKVEEDGGYTELRTSIEINIWIPQNFSEDVENTCKLKYAGILSAENSRHQLDINYPDDREIIRKETEDELYQKTYIPIKAKAEAEEKYGAGSETGNTVDSGEDSGQKQKGAPKQTPQQRSEAESRPGVTNQATRK